jgi:uncharacterized membrane protein
MTHNIYKTIMAFIILSMLSCSDKARKKNHQITHNIQRINLKDIKSMVVFTILFSFNAITLVFKITTKY